MLILGRPGLEHNVYPMKMIRTVTPASLRAQFRESICSCPMTMDKVLNCVKSKRLSGSFDYDCFLGVIVSRYVLVGEENTKFEDFCAKQYCQWIASLHLADEAKTTSFSQRILLASSSSAKTWLAGIFVVMLQPIP